MGLERDVGAYVVFMSVFILCSNGAFAGVYVGVYVSVDVGIFFSSRGRESCPRIYIKMSAQGRVLTVKHGVKKHRGL